MTTATVTNRARPSALVKPCTLACVYRTGRHRLSALRRCSRELGVDVLVQELTLLIQRTDGALRLTSGGGCVTQSDPQPPTSHTPTSHALARWILIARERLASHSLSSQHAARLVPIHSMRHALFLSLSPSLDFDTCLSRVSVSGLDGAPHHLLGPARCAPDPAALLDDVHDRAGRRRRSDFIASSAVAISACVAELHALSNAFQYFQPLQETCSGRLCERALAG